MPFDYNSFLTGVITGMQLPRTPGNILPPLPPVPSDRFILTESGEKVLTELESQTILLFAFTGTWYEANKTTWGENKTSVYVSDGKTYSLFGARDRTSDDIEYVLISGESFIGKTITFECYWGNVDPQIHEVYSEGPITESDVTANGGRGGIYYYYKFSLWDVQYQPRISSNDMTWVNYNFDREIVDIVANISSEPMITESGGE